jgi:hypothetical protein
MFLDYGKHIGVDYDKKEWDWNNFNSENVSKSVVSKNMNA